MKLTKHKMPLYHQLEGILRGRILNGALSSNKPFPTDYQLCEEFGVSRITVRQALKILEDDGLINREQGRGTFVIHNPQKTFFYEMSGSLDKVFDFREASKIELTSKKQVKADETIAHDLGVDKNDDIYLIEGRQDLFDNQKKAQFIKVYTHKDIGEKISLGDSEHPEFYLVLEKAALETAAQFNQIIYAVPANMIMAKVIKVQVGSALLVNKNIFLAKNGKVLGIVVKYSPGDSYQIIHKMKIKKTKK